jgi:hypothetical protein
VVVVERIHHGAALAGAGDQAEVAQQAQLMGALVGKTPQFADVASSAASSISSSSADASPLSARCLRSDRAGSGRAESGMVGNLSPGELS